MFGQNTLSSALTLTKVLGGIRTSLNIVNQVIPIYKEVKPMVTNARKVLNVLNVLKEINVPSPTKSDKVTLNTPSKEKTVKSSSLQSNPVFFQ